MSNFNIKQIEYAALAATYIDTLEFKTGCALLNFYRNDLEYKTNYDAILAYEEHKKAFNDISKTLSNEEIKIIASSQAKTEKTIKSKF